MTTAASNTVKKYLYQLKFPAVCNSCQNQISAGTWGDVRGGVAYCETCVTNHAIAKGYAVIHMTPELIAARQQAVQNGPSKQVEPGSGSGVYVSRVAYEKNQFALNERLVLRFGEVFGRLQKLEAENENLRDRLNALEAALGGVPAAVSKGVATGKEYQCSHCSEIFKSPQALGGHSKIHSDSPAAEAPLPQPNF